MRGGLVDHKDPAACVLLLLIAIGALHPSLGAGFVLVDDHEILSYSAAAVHSRQVPLAPILTERIFNLETASGRVRPLYWLIRMAEIAVLGQRPGLWHAAYLAMGLVAACLLYLALRLVHVGTLPALAAGAWLLVAPGVSSVWIRLGPQESLGTVLLLVSALAAAKGALCSSERWDALFAGALIAALLVKESFILAAPAMVGWRLFLRHLSHRRAESPWASVVPMIAASMALILASSVATHAGTASYGGKYLATLRPTAGDGVNLLVLGLLGGILTPLIAAGPPLAWRRHGQSLPGVRDWVLGMALVLLMVIPQLVLYRGGGFVVDRYVLPAGVGLAAGLAAGSSWLPRHNLRALATVCLGSWIALIAVFAIGTWRTAEVFRADSTQLHALLDTIDAVAPRGSILAIAADPANDSELAISLRYHIIATGRDDLDLRLLLPDEGPNETTTSQGLRAMLVERDFPGRHTIAGGDCARTWGVVLLTPRALGSDAWDCHARPILASHAFQEKVSPPLLDGLFPDISVGYALATFR